ncbi:hypothetical protein HYH02_013141 [Chlamydomonas schloesseri]|uniref:Uncharacterized protein n=1 Tax=Chlamydomonas schloesseri TaxID=2026947 RepID=A0A835VWG6_9CHLO|nr:hypothetical protein HYH02_013141 [Chlamydomonas schloesseri]|eukprot:KAG2431922.1 hypothetical protein HYH02_013141 [Chlamydomonas schloesseri]
MNATRDITHNPNTPSWNELVAQLSSIARDVQEAHDEMQSRVDGHRRAALDQLEATGGKQAQESHVKALKANWKFGGQKEAFLERVKAFRDTQELLQHDFSSDISIADKAVNTLKEEIRERNAAIAKMQQQLGGVIGQITRLYDTGKAAAAQLGMQLPRIAAELEEYQAGREAAPEPTLDGKTEEELLRLIAEEEAQAAALEAEAAAEGANWAAGEAERGALEGCVRELREEVAALEEECSAAAAKQGAKYSEQLQWYDSLASALTRLTGVEILTGDIDSCGGDGGGGGSTCLRLAITQAIPRAMPGREQFPAPPSCGSASQAASGAGLISMSLDPSASAAAAAGVGAEAAEHRLALEFEPAAPPGGAATAAASSQPAMPLLRGATLEPPVTDIGEDVRAALAAQASADARERAAALSGLLSDVKARVRQHCRRELQLSDANEIYPLQPTDVLPELLRCVLPNKVEVEVAVPLAWPCDDLLSPAAAGGAGPQLALVALQAPRSSQDLAPLLARLQQDLQAAQQPEEEQLQAQQSEHGGSSSAVGGSSSQAALRLRRQLRGCSLRELLDWVYGCIVAELGKQ